MLVDAITNNLIDILQKNNLTLKETAEKAGIKYTTLYAKVKQHRVMPTDIKKIAIVLEMTPAKLEKNIRKSQPVPFIKWVGGKTQLLPEIEKRLPKQYNRYFEPFLGGAAVLFDIKPKMATVNDLNGELINTYKQVKEHPQELIKLLVKLFENDSKENYLTIRAVDRTGEILDYSDLERAARFIYLNKAGYNGLWRVNQKGQNNVPYGQHAKLTVPANAIELDSKYFNENNVEFKNGDYQDCVAEAKKGDFVYFDPPYIPLNPTSSFTSYTKNGFGLVQQRQLAQLAKELADKGVCVMLSNSYTKLTKEIYADSVFHIHRVSARRSINRDGAKRGRIGEALITTY